MFNCTHDIDEGTSNGSTSQCATQLEAATSFEEHKTLETVTETAAYAPETQCEGGVCSLNWTPGTRH